MRAEFNEAVAVCSRSFCGKDAQYHLSGRTFDATTMHTVVEPLRLSRMNEKSRLPTEDSLRAPETDARETAEPVNIRSEDLLQGASEVRILHGNDVYRLRLTHNGRLILSK